MSKSTYSDFSMTLWLAYESIESRGVFSIQYIKDYLKAKNIDIENEIVVQRVNRWLKGLVSTRAAKRLEHRGYYRKTPVVVKKMVRKYMKGTAKKAKVRLGHIVEGEGVDG